MPPAARLHRDVLAWYHAHSRDLPWRTPQADPWAVLVSEVMLQQTPVRRVEPVWRAWTQRWPDAAALASAAPADVLRAWGTLGYPRRALRLQACAVVVVERHGGKVPQDVTELEALPGIGAYTAAAVAAFAFHRRVAVLDTNVRRVLARLVGGEALPAPSPSRAERDRAAALLPADPQASAAWNVGLMELGALVCTARAPRCASCPLVAGCAWHAAGSPPDPHAHRRRTQAWEGTDRQARGRLMAALRAGPAAGVDAAELARAWPEPVQRDRALASLAADRLVEVTPEGYRLPGAAVRGQR